VTRILNHVEPSSTLTSVRSAHHHASHTDLVDRVDTPVGDGNVDAIIVPTARSAPYMREVLRLAREVGCPVLALCSRWNDAQKAHAEARLVAAHVIASDVVGNGHMPAFATSTISERHWLFRRTLDTSLKRNIGLAVARMVGWRRVAFIDDDIVNIRAEDIRGAAVLLGEYGMVGLANEGFPDNSAVCHARRAAGWYQDSFVGGGAMVVTVDQTSSFFPNIYNEDWFFLVDGDRLRPTALTGKVAQKWFDPFDDPSRARHQELGDCLAEGLFSLLDDGQPHKAHDAAFWSAFLRDRGEIIRHIIGKIPSLDRPADEKIRMIASMKAAQGRRELITPQMCVDYIAAWQADRELWRDYLAQLPSGFSPRRALEHLGLTSTHIAIPR
jgi:hypothetical protein